MVENIKELVKNIRAELAKLKDVEDEKVKEIYTNLTSYVEKLDKPVDEKSEDSKKVEDKKEEEKVEESKEEKKEEKKEESEKETEKEPKTEEKPVKEEVKEEPKEEVKEVPEENSEEIKKEEVQLSKKVSEKLNEAALELQKFDQELKVKEEVISTQKQQIVKLSAQLKKYHDIEKIELEKKYDVKINQLIELYNNIGIKKEAVELKSNFNEEQINTLIIDLSAVIPAQKMISKPKRLTEVSLELNNKQIERKLNSSDTAKMLFGLE